MTKGAGGELPKDPHLLAPDRKHRPPLLPRRGLPDAELLVEQFPDRYRMRVLAAEDRWVRLRHQVQRPGTDAAEDSQGCREIHVHDVTSVFPGVRTSTSGGVMGRSERTRMAGEEQ